MCFDVRWIIGDCCTFAAFDTDVGAFRRIFVHGRSIDDRSTVL